MITPILAFVGIMFLLVLVNYQPEENGNNKKQCPCCGQLRPFPTEPGEWEYTEEIYFENPRWTTVSVRYPELNDRDGAEGLRLWKDGEMIWWPSSCAWRKLPQ